MARVFTELEDTINAIPCSPQPEKHTNRDVFLEFEEKSVMQDAIDKKSSPCVMQKIKIKE